MSLRIKVDITYLRPFNIYLNSGDLGAMGVQCLVVKFMYATNILFLISYATLHLTMCKTPQKGNDEKRWKNLITVSFVRICDVIVSQTMAASFLCLSPVPKAMLLSLQFV